MRCLIRRSQHLNLIQPNSINPSATENGIFQDVNIIVAESLHPCKQHQPSATMVLTFYVKLFNNKFSMTKLKGGLHIINFLNIIKELNKHLSVVWYFLVTILVRYPDMWLLCYEITGKHQQNRPEYIKSIAVEYCTHAA